MNRGSDKRPPNAPNGAGRGLPLRADPIPCPRTHARIIIIAHHLVLTGYRHWLSSDPRGSGSIETGKPELRELGPIHHGRKRIQPPRNELRAFYRKAEPLLNHETLWFDHAERRALTGAFQRTVTEFRYTVWACAILKNHAHLVVRRHRDNAITIWRTFADYARHLLEEQAVIAPGHPLWSERTYGVYLYTSDDVWDRIGYVEDNPEKENLPRQSFDFVPEYNGWPHALPR